MAETCNSRSFSWLVKSCLPDPSSTNPVPRRVDAPSRRASKTPTPTQPHRHHQHRDRSSSLSSLPDDLLLECLSRVPLTSLPSVSLVCRRFSLLLDSPAFLRFRRSHGLLRRSLYALSLSDAGLLSSSTSHLAGHSAAWEFPASAIPLTGGILDGSFSHARLAAVGRSIYVLGRNAAVRYDTWTGSVAPRSPTFFPRKKFAAASVAGKIYVAGGSARTSAVEEYDPRTDSWRVVAEAPRRRYGCLGAAAEGVFYVIGGLKIGGRGEVVRGRRLDAHVYAGTMDMYDVEAGGWLRARAVPGGGCVVGACAAGAHVYVLASHAVELSFWRWDGKGNQGGRRGGGEWARLPSPPVPGQVRVGGAGRFACVGVGESSVVVLVHVSASGCIGEVPRRGARSYDKEGLVLVYDIGAGNWSRGPDLTPAFRRAACICVEC